MWQSRETIRIVERLEKRIVELRAIHSKYRIRVEHAHLLPIGERGTILVGVNWTL
ncbi:MAG TPA: hypothetical protein VED37_13300 [Ktedonobacteraceae bacterium]|nr:hypothetical protein [Ktedonobacteraceae bacterium]